MTLEEYAKFVRSETRFMVPHEPTQNEIEVLALSNALCGEAGELANVVKKIIYKDVFLKPSPLHDQFVHEAGDFFWYAFRLVQRAGYKVEDILAVNKQRLEAKYAADKVEGVDSWRKYKQRLEAKYAANKVEGVDSWRK